MNLPTAHGRKAAFRRLLWCSSADFSAILSAGTQELAHALAIAARILLRNLSRFAPSA
jgi:hypothetical protein